MVVTLFAAMLPGTRRMGLDIVDHVRTNLDVNSSTSTGILSIVRE